MSTQEYPEIAKAIVKTAISALKHAGWQVNVEEGRFIDGSSRPLFRVSYPGYSELVGGIPIPYRKLWDFQLVEFADKHGKEKT